MQARYLYLQVRTHGHAAAPQSLHNRWVTAVTVVTAVLGCPLPIAVTVTLIPCMTVMTMVTVFLGYSLARAVTVMPPFFYPKPQGVG